VAGLAGVLAEGGVESRDRLGERNRQVEEERFLPGLLDGLDPQFAVACGGGVRLGGQQCGVQIGDRIWWRWTATSRLSSSPPTSRPRLPAR
jgi:hypothetical protein